MAPLSIKTIGLQSVTPKRKATPQTSSPDQTQDRATAPQATKSYHAITLATPTNCPPEQTIAVFDLVDDIRQRIWSFYQTDLQQITCQHGQPTPSDPLEINDDDLSL